MRHALLVFSMFMTFVCFWTGAVFSVRAINLRKAGLPLCPPPLCSPFNHLFFASHLSEAGLRARRVAIISYLALIAFVGLDFLLS
jgi:hypothetical protein